ncbi:MAG: GDYXXLXY domain-containing protein [Lentisphaeria bacterium]|nr:MAG: GDYXXLXY domain-containing protein [Lentisphaeria bacterium]
MKRWKWIAYLFASLLILAVVSAKIVRAEAAYRLGKSYRFPVQAYDPRDPFRGRYLALQMESVARSSDIPGGRTSGPLSCCVSIVVDEKGRRGSTTCRPNRRSRATGSTSICGDSGESE